MATPIMTTPIAAAIINSNPELRADLTSDTVPQAQPIPIAYPIPENMDPRLLNSNGQPIPQYYFVHPNFYSAPGPIGQPVYAQQFAPQAQPVAIVEHKVEYHPVKEPEPQVVVVEERRAPHKKDRAVTIVWVLFGLGFILPLLWWGGVGYTRSNNRSVRAGGILCLIFALLSTIAAAVFIYVGLRWW